MNERWLGDTSGTIKSPVLKGLMLVLGWPRKTSEQTFTRPRAQGSLKKDAQDVGTVGERILRRPGKALLRPSSVMSSSFS